MRNKPVKANEFGELLKELRQASGFKSQIALVRAARELGYKLDEGQLRRYEAGSGMPSLPAFQAIADTLGLTQAETARLSRTSNERPNRGTSAQQYRDDEHPE